MTRVTALLPAILQAAIVLLGTARILKHIHSQLLDQINATTRVLAGDSEWIQRWAFSLVTYYLRFLVIWKLFFSTSLLITVLTRAETVGSTAIRYWIVSSRISIRISEIRIQAFGKIVARLSERSQTGFLSHGEPTHVVARGSLHSMKVSTEMLFGGSGFNESYFLRGEGRSSHPLQPKCFALSWNII
jgi:hypothetical protein